MKVILSKIKDGKPSNSKLIRKAIEDMEGNTVKITIEKASGKRSSSQNSLWWVYMTILSKELGYTKDEMHEICKMKFLKKSKVDEKTGEVFEFLGNTSALNKSEFGDLVTELQQWSADTFGIVLPDPNDQFDMDFKS